MINPVDMSSIANVQERIAVIQERLGLGEKVPGMDFDKALKKEMDKLKKTAEAAKTLPANIQETVAKAREKAEEGINKIEKKATEASDSVISAHETGGTLQSFMEDAAAKYNLDTKLLSALAQVESGLNPDAVSGAGAIGVMQLMPDTAASLGVDPYNVKENIEGGAKYLRNMLDTFGGDVSKALAAYNAGPSAVKSYGGIPPYKETQNYVNSVLDIYR